MQGTIGIQELSLKIGHKNRGTSRFVYTTAKTKKGSGELEKDGGNWLVSFQAGLCQNY